MAYTRDEDVYPPGSIVRLKKTNEFARIKDVVYLKDGKNFLHYHGEIEGREGLYALYHNEIELEHLGPGKEKAP